MPAPKVTATPLAKLKPAEWNPRTIRDERFKNLCASIQADPEFLWRRPILAMADGTIYAGNMRYRAAAHVGLATVPAIVEDVPERLAKERALRDNAQWGDWHEDQLAEMVYQLAADGSDVKLLGIEEDELARLLGMTGVGGTEGLTDPDEMPENVPTRSKRGDLWLLGEHRVLCGDATDAGDHERLLGGAKVDLVMTDPPYGVGIDYESFEDTAGMVKALVAGFMPLVQKWPVVLLTPGIPAMWAYPPPKWVLAWIHPAASGGCPWGFSSLNPILAYGPDPYLAKGKGRRDSTLVLAADRKGDDQDHPVAKPIAVWNWLLERGSLNQGDRILDPFLGSGTTLIACEQLGRKCYGLEIEPKYVDVILQRWENFTGKTAVLSGD